VPNLMHPVCISQLIYMFAACQASINEGTRSLSLISDNSIEFQVVNVMYRCAHTYIHTHMIRRKVDILRYRLVKREFLWWTHVTD